MTTFINYKAYSLIGMNTRDQHAHIATLQKHWRADALRDRRYNLNRARIERRKGNRVLAAGYMKEASWDQWWANRRGRIAKQQEKMK